MAEKCVQEVVSRGTQSVPKRTHQAPHNMHSLPLVTSLWKREHLQALKIDIHESVCHSLNPKDIIRRLIEYNADQDYDKWSKLVIIVGKVANSMHKTLAFKLIDSSFESLTKQKGVIDCLATREDMWDTVFNDKDDEKIRNFKTTFKIAAKDFTEKLCYCIDRKDGGESVTEDMYQHLFISFLQLFSIRCQFAPMTPNRSMEINGECVTGQPDVLVQWLNYNANSETLMDWKTLLICKMKKHCMRNEEPPKKQMRYSSASNLVESSLSDAVLGQLGGELLLSYPSSVKNNCVIGMIVEKTHVTIALLTVTEKQYQQIMDGTLKDDCPCGPKLFLSKSYDYLLLEDRNCLTEALLTIGYLQNYGSEYFLRKHMLL